MSFGKDLRIFLFGTVIGTSATVFLHDYFIYSGLREVDRKLSEYDTKKNPFNYLSIDRFRLTSEKDKLEIKLKEYSVILKYFMEKD